MLVFTLSWSGNLSMTFAVPQRETKILDEYFAAMLPKDIYSLFNYGYHHIDTEDEFNRVYGFLQKQLTDFVFPKPTEISVRLKFP